MLGGQGRTFVCLLVSAGDVSILEGRQLLDEAVVLEVVPHLLVVDEGDDGARIGEAFDGLLGAEGDLFAVDRVLERLRWGGSEVAQVEREQSVGPDFEAFAVVAEGDEGVLTQGGPVLVLERRDSRGVLIDERLCPVFGAGGCRDEFEVVLPRARALVADRDDRGDGLELGPDGFDILGAGDDEIGVGSDDRLEVDLVGEEEFLRTILLGSLQCVGRREVRSRDPFSS